MKLFIVENQIIKIASFLEAINEKKCSFYCFSLGVNDVDDAETIRRFLAEVCREKPDVVVLDAALTLGEERLIDELELEGEKVTEDSLSGFKYCRALTNERLGIPVVFLTKCVQGKVARTAMQVGADRVLLKDHENEVLISQIIDIVKSRTPHDPAFYWSMRDKLEADGNTWHPDSLRKALDRFYLNTSSVRRFGLFTASFRGILSLLFKGDVEVERKLMLGLVKSQVLLSLVDPSLRDHVKHTGNVFWMGYRLLLDISSLQEPQSLTGCDPKLYGSEGALSPREQLLYSWTLAALFHDYGYVDERKSQITGLVLSLLPGAKIEYEDVRKDGSWVRNMHLLQDFVSAIFRPEHFLCNFFDFMAESFGNEVELRDGDGKKSPMVNHGLLGAHRLLNMIPLKSLDKQQKNIVLHAALAIACHHYVDILHKWALPSKCLGKLLIGEFPVSSLLIFCDTVQTWDREPELDPALIQSESSSGLLERLVLSSTAYVSGSEICEFIVGGEDVGKVCNVKLRLRYFVESAGHAEEACETLGGNIKRWIDSGRLREVCGITGVETLFQGQIVYELPMRSGIQTAIF